jgi:hypothetical protein
MGSFLAGPSQCLIAFAVLGRYPPSVKNAQREADMTSSMSGSVSSLLIVYGTMPPREPNDDDDDEDEEEDDEDDDREPAVIREPEEDE